MMEPLRLLLCKKLSQTLNREKFQNNYDFETARGLLVTDFVISLLPSEDDDSVKPAPASSSFPSPPMSERSLKKICLENRFATTKVVKVQLQDINVNASERTVRRKLKVSNFKTCLPTRKPKLIPAMKAKRLNWAKQWRDKDVDFWRSLEEWFPNGEPYIFLQDEAPCHTARSIKAFLAEQNVPLLNWLGNSPDMNLIENVLELMKREVTKNMITNKTQLLEKIIHMWNHSSNAGDSTVLY
ncbi:putative transposase like protein [Trichonephila clavipes]|nr:putative transposase like protein [Trichonephila clavipes]